MLNSRDRAPIDVDVASAEGMCVRCDETGERNADGVMEYADEAVDVTGVLTRAVHAAKQGDEGGFRYAYRTVQPGLLRYLTVLVGAEAEDIAAETWAQVCRDLARFNGDGDGFRGWVATIGRHRALDHLRARSRRGTDPAPLDALMGVPGSDDAAAAALEAVSTQTALAQIGSLPRDQAEAILLRVVIGLDAKSAGRVLGKRSGAVRTSAYRGLRRLAESLESGYVNEEIERSQRGAVTHRGLSTLT